MNDRDLQCCRARAVGIAYRILGTVSDAEDVAQEACLRLHDAGEIREPARWVRAVATHLAIDRLRARKRAAASYAGPWLPAPLVEWDEREAARDPTPEERLALAEEVELALLLVLENLRPEERAAFVLREAFDVGYAELAVILGRSEAACRQLVSRARQRVRARPPRFRKNRQAERRLREAFLAAVESGDLARFAELCSADVTLVSDGGGRAAAARRPLRGPWRILRFLVGIRRKAERAVGEGGAQPVEIRSARVNGDPGFVLFTGEGPTAVLCLEPDPRGRIRRIYMVRNPDKLAHIRPPHLADERSPRAC